MPESDPWTARAASSNLVSLVDALLEETRLLTTDTTIEFSPSDRANIARVRTIAEHASRVMLGSDPHLVSEATWNRVEERLERVRSALTTLRSDHNLGHVNTAAVESEAVLETLASVPAPPNGRRSRDSQAATTEFRRTLAELKQQAEGATRAAVEAAEGAAQRTARAMDSAEADTSARFEALRTELDTVRSEFANLRNLTEDAATRFRDAVAQEQTRLASLHTSWVETFTKTHSGQTEEWTKLKEQQLADFSATKAGLESEWGTRLTAIEDQIQSRLAFFDAQRQRVNQILGVTAASEAAGSFLQEAVEQRHEANYWRWASVAAWAAAVALGAWSAHDVVTNVDGLTTSELTAVAAVRTAFAGLVLTAAVWVSRQGAHHREREHVARRTASELTSFRPFIAELDDAALVAQVTAAAGRYFVGPTVVSQRTDKSAR